MNPVLQASGLSKRFGNLNAVSHLNLELYPGEVFGFLGPNGAGKSTTIRMLTGFLPPDQGKVRVEGLDPFALDGKARRRMGIVPDHLNMYENLSALEFLEFCIQMHELNEEAGFRAERFLKELQLWERRHDWIGEYSHGMRQKLALISAILHKPAVVFLDEPFTGMDAISIIRTRDLLREMAQEGMCIFFSSHILEIVERLCDRVGILMEGHLNRVGTVHELLDGQKIASLEELFLKAV